ncbi:hypothetical protein BKA70DRAFT_1404021 [Coprinopsis sp. MPI-PUGE-AT-0042]|nr:hypothetical protein BKA70DRAFT_1404021 [Coprinopsis sp. MPI-PUGE-AT-0042]
MVVSFRTFYPRGIARKEVKNRYCELVQHCKLVRALPIISAYMICSFAIAFHVCEVLLHKSYNKKPFGCDEILSWCRRRAQRRDVEAIRVEPQDIPLGQSTPAVGTVLDPGPPESSQKAPADAGIVPGPPDAARLRKQLTPTADSQRTLYIGRRRDEELLRRHRKEKYKREGREQLLLDNEKVDNECRIEDARMPSFDFKEALDFWAIYLSTASQWPVGMELCIATTCASKAPHHDAVCISLFKPSEIYVDDESKVFDLGRHAGCPFGTIRSTRVPFGVNIVEANGGMLKQKESSHSLYGRPDPAHIKLTSTAVSLRVLDIEGREDFEVVSQVLRKRH